jgi:hypothetical protein
MPLLRTLLYIIHKNDYLIFVSEIEKYESALEK